VDHTTTVTERRTAAAEALAAAPPAELYVLPELWGVGFGAYDDYADAAESLDDSPSLRLLADAARARSAWVHGGSLIERHAAGLSNTSVLLAPDGSLHTTYRKVHLFGYQSREASLLTPGQEVVTADVGEFRAGLATCYDLRFPELFRAQIDMGATLFLVASAWPLTRLEHWRLLNRTRAVENLAYLVACNTTGVDHGTAYAGHSLVVDPWGDVVAESDETSPAPLVADLDVQVVRRVRGEFPALDSRRPLTDLGHHAVAG
jgi:predicted amidohydrolase